MLICSLNARKEDKNMENPALNISEEQKQQLMAIKHQDGTSAYDYVMSWPEEDQPWHWLVSFPASVKVTL